MSALKFAALAWIIPALMGLLVGATMLLDRNVPYPVQDEPPDCFWVEPDRDLCPVPEPKPPSVLRNVASTLASEDVSVGLMLVGVLVGLGCSVTALRRSRRTRHEVPSDRLAFRLALAAAILLVAIPTCSGLVMFAIIASFPIRG